MGVTAGNRQLLERCWARELGVSPKFLGDAPEISCTVQHLYSGVQLFRRDNQLIVAAPPGRAAFIEGAIQGRSPDELFSVEFLQAVLGGEAERIFGPAQAHYADSTSFRSEAEGPAVRFQRRRSIRTAPSPPPSTRRS